MKRYVLPVLLPLLFLLPFRKVGLAFQAFEQTTPVPIGAPAGSPMPGLATPVTLPGILQTTATPLMPTVLPSPTSPPATITATATTLPPQILSPQPGQALQGAVSILGAIPNTGFISYEIAFSYSNDTTNTWFPIQQTAPFTESNTLAQWDTTTISDGEYALRLIASRTNGKQFSLTIPGLRVRNYTPIETDTPVPPTLTNGSDGEAKGDATSIPAASPTNTSTPAYTAIPITPLPTNPAQFSVQEATNSLKNGILAAIVFFLLLFVYKGIRALFK